MGRSLRVALLSYRSKPHGGGQGVYVRALTRELRELGHAVHVFSGQPYPQLHLTALLGPVQGGAQVSVLSVQTSQPQRLVGTSQRGRCLLGQGQIPGGVPPPQRIPRGRRMALERNPRAIGMQRQPRHAAQRWLIMGIDRKRGSCLIRVTSWMPSISGMSTSLMSR